MNFLLALLATTLVTIDFDQSAGKMKPVNGVNNCPIRVGNGAKQRELQRLNTPYVRLHDTAGKYGGSYFVDVPNIFQDFDRDETDPANYDFTMTDALLKPLVEAGIKPFYRLGVTIENQKYVKAYRIHPPKDFAKWARICEHIIAHYNEGWANGFHWNLEYWEIWNEPENPQMWTGTREQYFELYSVAANHLKRRFPNIKVGGYAGCGFYALEHGDRADEDELKYIAWFEAFLAYISDAKTKAPLDFFSWHAYFRESAKIVTLHANYVRDKLDRAGFTATESVFDEWNWTSPDWGDFAGMRNMKGAVVAADALSRLQYGPVDLAMYYQAMPQSAYCGLLAFPTCTTTPAFEVFKFFGWMRKLGTAVPYRTADDDVAVIAAKNDSGRCAFLIANTSDKSKVIELDVKGAERGTFESVCYRVAGEKPTKGRLVSTHFSLPALSFVYFQQPK